jgi:hypothetical protein
MLAKHSDPVELFEADNERYLVWNAARNEALPAWGSRQPRHRDKHQTGGDGHRHDPHSTVQPRCTNRRASRGTSSTTSLSGFIGVSIEVALDGW